MLQKAAKQQEIILNENGNGGGDGIFAYDD